MGVALDCGVQSKLLVTDQLEMLELMEHNIRLNDIEDRATALILNWWVDNFSQTLLLLSNLTMSSVGESRYPRLLWNRSPT